MSDSKLTDLFLTQPIQGEFLRLIRAWYLRHFNAYCHHHTLSLFEIPQGSYRKSIDWQYELGPSIYFVHSDNFVRDYPQLDDKAARGIFNCYSAYYARQSEFCNSGASRLITRAHN
jgi:hypothetical protein